MPVPGSPQSVQHGSPRQYAALGPNAPVIAAAAIAHGLDPRVALAVAHGEGGFSNPAPRGDNNTSFGPFQLHMGGALPSVYDGRPDAANKWANSPAGINYAVQRIAAVTRGMQGQAAVDAAVRDFERPANPTPEVQSDVRFYQALVAGRPQNPLGAAGSAASRDTNNPGAGGFPTAGGSAPGVAPGTVPNVFESCHLTSDFLGFIPVPSGGGIVCYVTGLVKVTGMALAGAVLLGAGFYLMLPRYRASVNKATLGAAGTVAGLTPGGRAAKVASAAATKAAGDRREASATAKAASERARVSRDRARAREARAKAKAAEAHVAGGGHLYTPAENRKIARAQSRHPAGSRPDRVKG